MMPGLQIISTFSVGLAMMIHLLGSSQEIMVYAQNFLQQLPISIILSFQISEFNGNSSVIRTVKNVGSANSTYTVMISPPRGMSVQDIPSVLGFNFYGQNISFTE